MGKNSRQFRHARFCSVGSTVPAPSTNYLEAFLSRGICRRIIWGWASQPELLLLCHRRQHQLQLGMAVGG